MKKTFGLDLGVASIGWAVVGQDHEADAPNILIDCGVRIVPLDSKETDEFRKGGSVPTNHVRRQARGMRRNLHRFKLRKDALYRHLKRLGMMPDSTLLRQIPPAALYALRERALQERLTLQEIGRVFILLNTRRGFKSNRKAESDKEESAYKEEIKNREIELRDSQQTIGQWFAARYRNHAHYRVKQQLFNRHTYIEEFDRIWEVQAKYHPDVLTDSNRRLLRDKIIYHQRPLKSAKGLVGTCKLEWNYALDKNTHEPIVLPNGLKKIVRPKCAPKSSPLAQECKVWESLHNLRITDENGIEFQITEEHKRQIFEILQQEERGLSASKLFKDVLKISPKSYSADNLIKEKGLEGNRTRGKLLKVFKEVGIDRSDLLVFDPIIEKVNNPETGEEAARLQLRGDFDQQPLYQLWHLVYATQEESDLIRLLQERYQFTPAQAKALASIDFTSAGYANKSHRAMRRLLPHYRKGLDYANACNAAGYNHSNSLTQAENQARTLLTKLEVIPKNSLRNPVVEKVLNQMIHVVNDLIAQHGTPDEICVELARELRQNAEQRKKTTRQIAQREKENKRIRQLIAEDLGIQPESVTRVQIDKWKLGEETGWISLYTGNKVDRATFLLGEQIDIEHIIPKVRRFDDSFNNKTFCESKINQEKSNLTAHDFMKIQAVKGLQPYEGYIKMVNTLLAGKQISEIKHRNLLMTAEDVANDASFLERQLRETQYITSKARDLLSDVCYKVQTTTGGITDFLRHQWGWKEVIEDSRMPQFRKIGRTKVIQIRKGTQSKEVIEGWDKRKDHRHHALDALTAACTTQSHIHRINNLNQILDGRLGSDKRQNLLQIGRDKYIAGPAPFSHKQVMDAMDHILVSFKQKNRVSTRSKNNFKRSKERPQITLTPRGAFHEETIYGRIRQYSDPIPLDGRFKLEWIDQIAHPHQKALVEARLAEFGGDPKKAFNNLEKHPIYYGAGEKRKLKTITLWKRSYVSRLGLGPQISESKVDKIVDKAVRIAIKNRFIIAGKDAKKAFENLSENPIMMNGLPISSVRTLKPSEKMIRLPRGYAKSDGNHHIAIYQDETGKRFEHVVPFWDAFQRVRLGLPAIITDIAAAHDHVAQLANGVPDDLLLPGQRDWQFVTSLSINDMFVFGIDSKEIDFLDPRNRKMISAGLFKVRSLSSKDYRFIHHLETEIEEGADSEQAGLSKRLRTIDGLNGSVKIKLNRLGHITGIVTLI